MEDKAYLHDAKILAIEVDVIERRLVFRMDRYMSAESRERIKSTIEFRNVLSFSGVLDLMSMASNAWAGNVTDWEPSAGHGLSHLYFAQGTFSIHADEPEVL